MACETKLKPRQTISQRKAEVRAVVSFLDELIRKGKVKVVVDKRTGAVAFNGMTDSEKDGVTDNCAYRRIMSTGSALARAAIAQAELVAGRSINKQAVAQGVHSHDGGLTFHDHKG
jgi:hypothetical protein